MRGFRWLALGLLCLMTVSGCGNAVDRLLASESLRTALWNRVAGSPELAGQVVDRLLSADSTRTAMLDRIMASGGARQRLLAMIATDRTLMDGAINFAVQDSSMRDHLVTLVKGMEMVGSK
jgi:hypothetical protein